MANQEGQQIDTLPVQMYGWDGRPVRLDLEHIYPSVKEYRAEYSGDNLIYEGWSIWIENGNSITDEVWRIAKHVYSGSNKIQTMYAGDGSYNYKWDDRVSLFPIEGVINFVFQDDNSFIFQDGNNFIFREA